MFKFAPTTLQLCAALVWTFAGLKLLYRGMSIVLVTSALWVIGVTILVGFIKSRIILDRVCRSNGNRLRRYNENESILHIFPLRTWLIIGTMIIFGRLLRLCPAGQEWSGLFSLAVGCGLLFSSRISWKGWWYLRAASGKE